MEKELSLKIATTIHAPLSTVWDALTNPEQIKKYLFGTEAISDWKVGSPLIFQGEWEGKSYIDKAVILELEENKKLKYNYWSSFSGTEDIPENYANVTYEIEWKGDHTVLTVQQDGIKTQEKKEHSEKTWQAMFETLKTILETKAAN